MTTHLVGGLSYSVGKEIFTVPMNSPSSKRLEARRSLDLHEMII